MKRYLWLAALAAATITGPALDVTAAAPAGAGPVQHGSSATAAGGTRLWLARFGCSSVAADMVESPSGSAVFVTGWSGREGTFGATDEGTTLAYNTATGARLWADHYFPGPRSHVQFTQLAVSPDGSRVFTVASDFELSGSSGQTFLTVAYNAATGAQLWADKTTVKGFLNSVAVSPNGKSVYVTGFGRAGVSTVAYNAATGAQLWAQDSGIGNGVAVAASPDGSAVYVTGTSTSGTPTTVAYSAATGNVLWATPASIDPVALAMSADGSRLFITGGFNGPNGTEAFNAATGAPLWTKPDIFRPGAIAVSPDGSTVFIADTGQQGTTSVARVIAYTAATGILRWIHRTSVFQPALTVSPDDATLFLAGEAVEPNSDHPSLYGTAALDTGTGAQLWIARYRSAFTASADGVAVTPDGSRVVVTGTTGSPEPGSVPSIVTLAYSS
jgi:DNA-binding beta-propeller fold protein YncE